MVKQKIQCEQLDLSNNSVNNPAHQLSALLGFPCAFHWPLLLPMVITIVFSHPHGVFLPILEVCVNGIV